MARSDTIWEALREGAETLPEPFIRAALVSWVSKRRPDAQLRDVPKTPLRPA